MKRKTISENGHCWWRVKVDFDAARLRENIGTEIGLRPELRNLDQCGDGSSVGARKEGKQEGLINTYQHLRLVCNSQVSILLMTVIPSSITYTYICIYIYKYIRYCNVVLPIQWWFAQMLTWNIWVESS